MIYSLERATVTVNGVIMSTDITNQFSKAVAKYRDARNWCQSTTKKTFNEPVRYESWVAYLVDLGERVRMDARSGPGRWAKR